jgi:transcriptional regulator with XRE-family HTH domain
MTAGPIPASFGFLLRQWRVTRGKTQLALATEAGISTRHLSFLETGRAQPSREMVQLLTAMLDVPLHERNALLLAAGYAPLYGERGLDATDLEQLHHALDFILRQQEPYPALVIDGEWNILRRNAAADRIFGFFAGQMPYDGARPNAMRALFHPKGLRRCVSNWEELAFPMLRALRRQAALDPGESVARLHDEVLAYLGVSAKSATAADESPIPPMRVMRLRKGDVSMALFCLITVLQIPCDTTLQNLRVECFYPADRATEEAAHRFAAAAPAVA